ncbi:TPA: DUF6864 domain-containing function [Photobacterium damselae]
MTLKLKTETKDILYSGSLITFSHDETIFELNHNDEELRLRVKFVDEQNKHWKEHGRVLFEPIDAIENATDGRITFFNFNNPLGVYSNKPMLLGDIGGRRLYFQYKIDDMTESTSKVITYTFYLGESVNG